MQRGRSGLLAGQKCETTAVKRPFCLRACKKTEGDAIGKASPAKACGMKEA